MDVMKIGSNLMKRVIAKVIEKVIRDKLEYKINILLNEMEATIIDGKAHVHLNVDAEMSKDELMKLIKNAGL